MEEFDMFNARTMRATNESAMDIGFSPGLGGELDGGSMGVVVI